MARAPSRPDPRRQEVVRLHARARRRRPRRPQGRGRRRSSARRAAARPRCCAASTCWRPTTTARSRSTASRSATGRDRRAARRRSDGELARIRADIGMVFQLFNLFPHLTARRERDAGAGQGPRHAGRRGHARTRSTGSTGSASRRRSATCRASSPAASSSASASPAPSRWSPRCCCSTRSPRRSTPSWSARCWRWCSSSPREGMTMVVVTHEMTFARDVGTPRRVHGRGRIAVEGPPRDILGRTRPRAASRLPGPHRDQAPLEEAHHAMSRPLRHPPAPRPAAGDQRLGHDDPSAPRSWCPRRSAPMSRIMPEWVEINDLHRKARARSPG